MEEFIEMYPEANLGGFRGSADPQLIFFDKIGLLEMFFSF
jgi:hypothetical protein